MKRIRPLLLICLIPACFMAACKDPYPSAPTTVTGRIVDESGKPLKGVGFSLSGDNKRGITAIPTFYVESESDENGEYTISYVVPKPTDKVVFSMGTIIDGKNYLPYIDYGSSYKSSGNATIRRGDYGKTTILNFQFRKL